MRGYRQAYSDPKRANSPTALPDVEIFYVEDGFADIRRTCDPGWYYWACFPGCLPDGDPIGPFATEDEALADAQAEGEEEEEEGA